jgi:hypothetical protein
MVYGHLQLPPFPRAEECTSLFLSCRQAKTEIEEEAAHKLKVFLDLWRRWNAAAQPRIGPILTSPVKLYRDITHIIVTGMPASRPELLPTLASMRLNILHVVVTAVLQEIALAQSELHRGLRKLIKHMAVKWRSITGGQGFTHSV